MPMAPTSTPSFAIFSITWLSLLLGAEGARTRSGQAFSLKEDVLQELTSNERCSEPPPRGFNNLGTGLDLTTCEKRCLKIDSCVFMGMKDGACTSWMECPNMEADEGTIMYQKVQATSATTTTAAPSTTTAAPSTTTAAPSTTTASPSPSSTTSSPAPTPTTSAPAPSPTTSAPASSSSTTSMAITPSNSKLVVPFPSGTRCSTHPDHHLETLGNVDMEQCMNACIDMQECMFADFELSLSAV
eukprot:CAMPEP_0170592648 /NCGR_PEP_ID=MMETSP0224-20130122/13032_1 /TAXON_ID=285029 /ORGANISM="Togula jolla, Strain CCCM 725" /LENGTH=242 /DNA_ID=CAMNT_0010916559 /DNA_START=60 /DNA_END=784 /DNA_ORIENTATION=-